MGPLAPGSAAMLPREPLVDDLHHLLLNANVLVSGPPGSGKSTLVRLYMAKHPTFKVSVVECKFEFYQYAGGVVPSAIALPTVCRAAGMPPSSTAAELLNSTDLLVLDDSQVLYGADSFWEQLLKSYARGRVLAVATIYNPIRAPSPAAFGAKVLDFKCLLSSTCI